MFVIYRIDGGEPIRFRQYATLEKAILEAGFCETRTYIIQHGIQVWRSW